MIIKDVLPDVRVANETRELLNQCCVEFVKHVAKEAQIISSKDLRKTIYHDHVQKGQFSVISVFLTWYSQNSNKMPVLNFLFSHVNQKDN